MEFLNEENMEGVGGAGGVGGLGGAGDAAGVGSTEDVKNTDSNNDQVDNCCICLDPINAPSTNTTETMEITEIVSEDKMDVVVVVKCKHMFHSKCLLRYAIASSDGNIKCPLCRGKIGSDCYKIYEEDEKKHMKNYIENICKSPMIVLAYLYDDCEFVYLRMRDESKNLYFRQLTYTETLANTLRTYSANFYESIIKSNANVSFKRHLTDFCANKNIDSYKQATEFFHDANNKKNFGEFQNSKNYKDFRASVKL